MAWREYHKFTKLSVESLRRTRRYLDWANMPDPFRHYEGVPILDLPADPPMPEISEIEVLSRTKKDANWRPEKSLLSSTLSGGRTDNLRLALVLNRTRVLAEQ